MDKGGFRLIFLILSLSMLPVHSNAVVEEKSSIIGKLIGNTNAPFSGITIRLLDAFLLDEIAEVVSDRQGKFTIPNLLPGLYLLSVEVPSLKGVFKRVQVVSGAPTFVDIRPILDKEELKAHSAWDKFKWTIRVAERNPLRDAEKQTLDGTLNYRSDGFFALLKSFQEENNIEGEFSYVSVGGRRSSSNLNHQMAQFAVQGDLEGEGSWSINGNFLEGPRSSYIASGALHYPLFGHRVGATFAANDLVFARYPGLLERQRITRFVQSPDPQEVAEESKLWITSVDLQDGWNLFERLRIDYGTRIDYYGYLQDSVSYSPRVELTFQLDSALALRGTYYRNQSAPGNFYLQPDEVHPYIHDIAFVPYGGTLSPETITGYEAGFDYSNGDLSLSAVYHAEDTADKIATVDLSSSPINDRLQSIRPFVIFNARGLQSHGVEIKAGKNVLPNLKTIVSYDIKRAVPVYIIEKRSFSQRQIFFVNGREIEEFHDLQVGIETDIDSTQTQVNAYWKWSSGSPLIFGRVKNNNVLSTVDVEVRQGIPVQVFPEAELKLLVAIKNLLDQNTKNTANADFQRALLYGMPRIFAGGILVEF